MRQYEPNSPATDAKPSVGASVSVWWYGALCFLCLSLTVLMISVVGAIAGFKPPTGTIVVLLILSIHFANWRFVRKHQRALDSQQLKSFAIACGVAFCICDESFALVARISSDTPGSIEGAVTVVVAVLIDLAIAAAVVYGTVPWISKRMRGANA